MNNAPFDKRDGQELPTIQRIDLVCDAFESAWSNGERPVIEEFLGDTEGEERDQLIRELVALDIEYREKQGETPHLEEYSTRFQSDQSNLQTLFLPETEIRKAPSPAEGDSTIAESLDGTHLTVPPTVIREQDNRSSHTYIDVTDRPLDEVPADIQQFGDYEILSEIARGGMGVVYKAYQKSLNRVVALKMIGRGEFANEAEIRRFQIEAESAAGLDHPGIVPVYEVGEKSGRNFFSMGYVDGGSLNEKVTDQSLSPHEIASLMRRIAEAVAYAHSKGIIHRDLKPRNVLLDKNGEPRITDFGLAKKIDEGSQLTVTGQILGTPSYMPPEQAGGTTDEITESADIYSLGAVLYALLCGRPPLSIARPIEHAVTSYGTRAGAASSAQRKNPHRFGNDLPEMFREKSRKTVRVCSRFGRRTATLL